MRVLINYFVKYSANLFSLIIITIMMRALYSALRCALSSKQPHFLCGQENVCGTGIQRVGSSCSASASETGPAQQAKWSSEIRSLDQLMHAEKWSSTTTRARSATHAEFQEVYLPLPVPVCRDHRVKLKSVVLSHPSSYPSRLSSPANEEGSGGHAANDPRTFKRSVFNAERHDRIILKHHTWRNGFAGTFRR